MHSRTLKIETIKIGKIKNDCGNVFLKKYILIILLVLLSLVARSTLAAGHTGYVTCSSLNLICKNYNRYNTKYPIVLVHGVSGFDSLLGLMDYFHDIPESLEGNIITGGRAKVYVANVTAWEDAYVRGEQLLQYIQNTVLPDSGASKVNLIGHSLGGPTIRYVAGVKPGIVASITTVNAVNYGSGFADWGMQNIPEGTPGNAVVEDLLNALGDIIDALAGNPEYEQDALEAVKFLTTAGATTFNQKFPAGKPTTYCGKGPSSVNGVRYFSWGGTGTISNVLDVSDYFLSLTGSLGYWNGDSHDGLVARCSMHWGEVIRDNYDTNHLDAVNLLFGLRGWTNPVSNFQNQAARLRGLGL
jgi:triacylglycerol lipase